MKKSLKTHLCVDLRYKKKGVFIQRLQVFLRYYKSQVLMMILYLEPLSDKNALKIGVRSDTLASESLSS